MGIHISQHAMRRMAERVGVMSAAEIKAAVSDRTIDAVRAMGGGRVLVPSLGAQLRMTGDVVATVVAHQSRRHERQEDEIEWGWRRRDVGVPRHIRRELARL